MEVTFRLMVYRDLEWPLPPEPLRCRCENSSSGNSDRIRFSVLLHEETLEHQTDWKTIDQKCPKILWLYNPYLSGQMFQSGVSRIRWDKVNKRTSNVELVPCVVVRIFGGTVISPTPESGTTLVNYKWVPNRYVVLLTRVPGTKLRVDTVNNQHTGTCSIKWRNT